MTFCAKEKFPLPCLQTQSISVLTSEFESICIHFTLPGVSKMGLVPKTAKNILNFKSEVQNVQTCQCRPSKIVSSNNPGKCTNDPFLTK